METHESSSLVKIFGSFIIAMTILIGGYLNLVYTVEIMGSYVQGAKFLGSLNRIKIKVVRKMGFENNKIKWSMRSAIDDKTGNPQPNITVMTGPDGKALYFNGNNSFIQTPLEVHEWDRLEILFWVKPEKKEDGSLSVIFDNGHTSATDFTVQTADESGKRWVWHCNGLDIFLDLPLNQWSFVTVSADRINGVLKAYVDDFKVGEIRTGKTFRFGSSPLTIGKLANSNERFFKGAISDLIVLKK